MTDSVIQHMALDQATSKMAKFQFQQRYSRTVKKIDFLLGSDDIQPPTGQREYFYEAVGINKQARLIPITFNRVGVLAERITKIADGDLHEAYVLHWVAGQPRPGQSERLEYPWWASYHDRMLSAACILCDLPLGEDRAISTACWHQLCTACACYLTAVEWNGAKKMTHCPKCYRPHGTTYSTASSVTMKEVIAT